MAAPISGRGARDLLQFLRLVGQLKVSGRREGRLGPGSRLRGERPGPAAGRRGSCSPPGPRPAPFLSSPGLLGSTEETPPDGCGRASGPWSEEASGGDCVAGLLGPTPGREESETRCFLCRPGALMGPAQAAFREVSGGDPAR